MWGVRDGEKDADKGNRVHTRIPSATTRMHIYSSAHASTSVPKNHLHTRCKITNTGGGKKAGGQADRHTDVPAPLSAGVFVGASFILAFMLSIALSSPSDFEFSAIALAQDAC